MMGFLQDHVELADLLRHLSAPEELESTNISAADTAQLKTSGTSRYETATNIQTSGPRGNIYQVSIIFVTRKHPLKICSLKRSRQLTPTYRSLRKVAVRVRPISDFMGFEIDGNITRYIGVGVGLASLITENLLSHPFVVLRRQCQVHNNSSRYHLVPITLLPVIVHLHGRQGITTLWKGLGSILMIRGMTLAIEDLISKLTPWPKEITWHSSLKSFGKHILLKCATLAIITPFYSASLVETVQSDIASEKPGFFDVFREGICRLVSWSSPQKGRMLPVLVLVVPTVMYGLLRYVLTVLVRGAASRIMRFSYRRGQEVQGALSRDEPSHAVSQDIELTSSLIGLITADVVLFPMETVLHRLHLQGTRTIIDNLDSGYEVIPILTSYEGARDCYVTTLQQEGVAGLYKGFGALILQFAAHVAVVKLTKIVLTEISSMLRSAPRPSLPPSSSHPNLTHVPSSHQSSSNPSPGYGYTQQIYLPYE
ncbi:solute carrier family 25 member 46-like [Zootermopsis nevadensis]|uniref:Solute carrier family 25 member 46 n=1 Tax=Zootermopsis nevadensis TaxID=136037 RepID=A0A067QQG7_ZOONE|nr:solute carrier family 25 member 46-like [Zootermopsis nevadensis]KDR12085.1 Solute carrier family 25 member 46 [Zootermopsis nevadensis]